MILSLSKDDFKWLPGCKSRKSRLSTGSGWLLLALKSAKLILNKYLVKQKRPACRRALSLAR
jgi:hypothetical protein